MSQEAICPYCNRALVKFPGRKTKCPNCGDFIFVRTDSRTGNKTLLTDKQTRIHDWVKRLVEEFGISEKMYENARARNPGQPEEQTILDLLGARAKRSRKDSFDSASFTYSSMGWFVHEGGGDPVGYLQLAAKAQLDSFQDEGVKSVEILSSPDSCPACLALQGKVFPIEQALQAMPLPSPNCTNIPPNSEKPICRCLWVMGEK